MNICKICGEQILWVTRDNDRRAPLVFAGQHWVEHDSGKFVYVSTYDWHRCDDETVLACQERMSNQLAKQEERQIPDLETRDAFAKEVYRLAMKYGCVTCGAQVGEPCENLTQRRYGRVIYTVNPHHPRFDEVPSNHRPYWNTETTFVKGRDGDD